MQLGVFHVQFLHDFQALRGERSALLNDLLKGLEAVVQVQPDAEVKEICPSRMSVRFTTLVLGGGLVNMLYFQLHFRKISNLTYIVQRG